MPDPKDPDDFDGPTTPEEDERHARAEAARREAELELEIFDGIRSQDGGPVLPVRLKPADMFCFSCHRGISCWNECCHGADITLTPADILRLTRRLDMRPAEFLAAYAVPRDWDQAGLPVAKLRAKEDSPRHACVFLDEDDACTVYSDRPATCRYYPLGLGAFKVKDAEEQVDFHFLVKEAHCKGHDESKLQSVAEFRRDQQVGEYDAINRGWMDILMKMASWRSLGGPYGKEVSDQTKRMFYMVSTDIDAFRRFVFETRFLETYMVDEKSVEELRVHDEALLQLGFDWMKNVLFNEPTISLREDVLRQAIAARREEMGGA
jgi:hypothetical protein